MNPKAENKAGGQAHARKRTKQSKRFLPFTLGVMAAAATTAFAQVGEDFLSRTAPTPPYRSPQPQRYNLKWGKLTGRLHASVVAEFNDNINLSSNNAVADIGIGPEVGIGFIYPISERNVLQLDLEAGYRWWMKSKSVSTLTISPKSLSRLDYYLYFDEGRINFHDIFYAQTSAVDFGAVNGTGGVNLGSFRRFVNTAGVMGDWRPVKQWVFYAGYDYTIDRSLTSSFRSLDRDDHTFTSGVNYIANSRLTVGAYSAFTYSTYSQHVQNDGWNFTTGPRASYQLSKFVTLEASAGFTTSDYFNTGTVLDNSNFNSVTYQAGIEHTINKDLKHALRGGRVLGLGYGSNFTDTYNIQYSFNWLARQGISVYGTFAYEDFTVSNNGEEGQRYLFNIGTGYQITRQWNLGVNYAYALKESDVVGNDYTQNRLILELRRQF